MLKAQTSHFPVSLWILSQLAVIWCRIVDVQSNKKLTKKPLVTSVVCCFYRKQSYLDTSQQVPLAAAIIRSCPDKMTETRYQVDVTLLVAREPVNPRWGQFRTGREL